MEPARALARHGARADLPRRPHHGHGRRRRAEVRRLSARGSGRGAGHDPGELHRRAPRTRRHVGDGRLEPSRRRRPHRRTVRRLAVRLARRAGRHRRGRRDPRVPDGRPRPASALDVRSHHAARRCRARALPERLERGVPGDPRRTIARLPPRHRAERRGRARGVRGGPASRHDAPVGHDPAARAGAGHAARPRSGAGWVRGHPRRHPRAGAAARSPTRTSWPPGSTPNSSTSGRRSPRRGDRERAGRIDSTSAGSAGSSRRCAAACCVPPARPSTCPTSPMPRSRCSAPFRSEPCAARPRSPRS